MTKFDDAIARPESSGGLRMNAILAKIADPDEREAVERALFDITKSQRLILVGLRALGLRVSRETVAEWRRENGVTHQ